MPHRGSPERRVVNTTGAALFLAVVCALALVALSRPIDRAALPDDLEELQADLASLHRGEGPCARWPEDRPPDPDDIERFTQELAALAAPDLHVALPLLSHIRALNHDASAKAHALEPRQEVIFVALDRLPGFDRLRLNLSRDDYDDLLPMLQGVADRDMRLDADRRRAHRLSSTLTDPERQSLDALARKWRHTLASDHAQAALLHHIAAGVTRQRLDALEGGLSNYHDHYGRYPAGLRALLEHMARIERLPDVLRRGQERDGTLRDGWLRPFVYYTRGPHQRVLISDGPRDDTEADDICAGCDQDPPPAP